jgi:GT2 family glycosyltransferase
MTDISVIIVSFNTKDLTLQCINSIFTEGSKLKKEVILVENGSSDGSVEALKKLENKIILIENSENLGFSKANNQGIKIHKGKFILLLNSDTILKERTLEKLVTFTRNKVKVGVVAPKLLNPDGSDQPSVFNFPTVGRALQQYWLKVGKPLEKYIPQGSEPSKVEAVVMAAFLITPMALKKVGMLEERYFMFFEDLDYCRRVCKSGLDIYYLPDAEVFHHHGASGKTITNSTNQWRRLIPSSKIYHGLVKHYVFNFILWSGQKWQKLIGKN